MNNKIFFILIVLLILITPAIALNEDGFTGGNGILNFFELLQSAAKIDGLLGRKPIDVPCIDKAPGYCDNLATTQKQPFSQRMRNLAEFILPDFLLFQKKQADSDIQTNSESERVAGIKSDLKEKTRDMWKYITGIIIIIMDILKTIFYISIYTITIYLIFVFIPLMFINLHKMITKSIVGVFEKQRSRNKK